MAQIDIRHAEILFIDGFTLVGAINQAGGYPLGATTMVIDGMSTPIANASTFTIAGDATTYTVSSTAGGATPTSVTFTPALTKIAADNAVISFRLVAGAVDDVAGVAIGQGTVTIDGLTQAIPNSSTVKFSGHATIYTITSTTGGSTPTAMTFTPVLTSAVIDNETLLFQIKGAVNKAGTATPANGDTTITVDGMTKAVPIGNRMTIAGSTGSYTVVSSSGGATPTSITFTPALATAAGIPVDNAVVTISHNVLGLSIGEGNLTFEEKRTINYVREKKSITNGFVMTGDDEPIDVSLDLIWEFLSSDAAVAPTPEEALRGEGPAASWISTGADLCEPFALDIEILYTPPCEGAKAERILLGEYRWESISHDLKAGTMSTKGKCKLLLTESTRETPPLIP